MDKSGSLVCPLFKAKRAIYELTKVDIHSIVVDKIKRVTYIVDGHTMRAIATLNAIGQLEWSPQVEASIRERTQELLRE